MSDAPHSPDMDEPTHLERELLAALAAGPQQIAEQIRFILALSALVEPLPAAPYPSVQPSPQDAQLSALTDLADELPQAQVVALYEAVQQIDDAETRIFNQVKLALWLPPQHFQDIIRSTWAQIHDLEKPQARAQILLQLAPLLTVAQDEPAAPAGLLEIVALAQAISNPEARIRSLVGLVPHLPLSMRTRVLHRVIDEIDKLSNDSQRAAALCSMAHLLGPEVETRALRSAASIHIPAERARAFTGLAQYLPVALQSTLREDALTVIASIRNEEDRAEALMAFAPHLEYVTDSDYFPLLLEKALTIAISIKRRHLRARVLVALAPHLTLDLQGEALAAVHSLSSERERAMLLAQLAPTLPPNMLVASLAVAHSMAEQDSRVHALTVLAQYVPESAHERTVLDALAAASSLPNAFERVSALLNLIDVLPPDTRARTFVQSLDTTRLIDNENARARALSSLAPALPAELHSRAQEIALAMSNAEQRLSALTSLAQAMDEASRPALAEHLMDATRDLTFEYKRARAISDIAPLVSQDMISPLLRLAQEIEDPMDRIAALSALIPRLPLDQRRTVTVQGWHLIAEIDNGYDAASALVILAPLLPENAAKDLARRASMIIGSIMDDYDQASAITILAPLIAVPGQNAQDRMPDKYAALEKALLAIFELSSLEQRLHLLKAGADLWTDISESDQSYPLWQNVAQRLSTMPQADTLLALAALRPVIRFLGGGQAVPKMAEIFGTILTKAVAQSD